MLSAFDGRSSLCLESSHLSVRMSVLAQLMFEKRKMAITVDSFKSVYDRIVELAG